MSLDVIVEDNNQITLLQ